MFIFWILFLVNFIIICREFMYKYLFYGNVFMYIFIIVDSFEVFFNIDSVDVLFYVYFNF